MSILSFVVAAGRWRCWGGCTLRKKEKNVY